MSAKANATPKGVALITGASGSIGGAVAVRLASEGFAVGAAYAGRPDRAVAVAQQIKAAGGRAIAVEADVADPQAVAAMFGSVTAELGPVTVVVHCAGIMPLTSIADGQLDVFDKVITVNLRGTYVILAEAARTLPNGGRMIAFSSSVLAKSFPGYGPYIASKAGTEGLVKVLANELRGRNICVNAVAPGPVATPLFLNGKTEAEIAQLAKVAPLERLGQPEDIAGTVAFLAGPDGAWINGQVLRANGGFA
jgi:3-oxoacyl-[acyl-carrier protein] reductase